MPITPKKLHDAFLLLNAAIEACYNHNNSSTDIALALNTNSIIKGIYYALLRKTKKVNITDVGKPSNPIAFYEEIIIYLASTSYFISPKFYRINYVDQYDKLINNRLFINIPSMIFIETYDSLPRGSNIISSLNTDMPLTFTITKPGTTETIKYQLDSVVVRDTKKKHFCALFMCNGLEYGFDGASFLSYVSFQLETKVE
jgi:hypothetical protein